MSRHPGGRTLLTSVVLSAPGPIVMGLGLLLGRSSTQLADFIRRSVELAAIVVSWLVFRAFHRDGEPDPARQQKLEGAANTTVGAAMCLSGVAMVGVTLMGGSADKGNVLPGLVIALLGLVTNSWFWWRYRSLDRGRPSAILAAQGNLYRAKSMVDACVSTALLAVVVAPGTQAAHYLDVGGSLAVATYLIATGVVTVGRRPALTR